MAKTLVQRIKSIKSIVSSPIIHNRYTARVLLGIGALTIIVAPIGYIHMRDNYRLEQRYTEVQNDRDGLSGRYDSLRAEYSELQKAIDALTEKFQEAKLGNSEVEAEKSKLQSANDGLNEDYRKLAAKFADIQEDYSRLDKEKQGSEFRLQESMGENAQLANKNESAKLDISRLTEANKHAQETISALGEELGELETLLTESGSQIKYDTPLISLGVPRCDGLSSTRTRVGLLESLLDDLTNPSAHGQLTRLTIDELKQNVGPLTARVKVYGENGTSPSQGLGVVLTEEYIAVVGHYFTEGKNVVVPNSGIYAVIPPAEGWMPASYAVFDLRRDIGLVKLGIPLPFSKPISLSFGIFEEGDWATVITRGGIVEVKSDGGIEKQRSYLGPELNTITGQIGNFLGLPYNAPINGVPNAGNLFGGQLYPGDSGAGVFASNETLAGLAYSTYSGMGVSTMTKIQNLVPVLKHEIAFQMSCLK